MDAAVMLCHYLDVLTPDVSVRIFVLDANVRKMNLVVEVRQVVFARPGRDLGLAPVRSAVAVASAAIAFLQKALIVAFQLAVQLHPLDAPTLIAQAFGSFEVGPIELRIVAALAGTIGTRIELLTVVSLVGAVSFEKRTSAVCEGNRPVLVIHRNSLDEPLPFEVAEVAIADLKSRITRVAEVALQDHSKCPYRRQRASVGAVQAIVVIAVTNQLALGSAGEFKITREDIARIGGAAIVIAVAPGLVAIVSFPIDSVAVSRCWTGLAARHEPVFFAITNAVLSFTTFLIARITIEHRLPPYVTQWPSRLCGAEGGAAIRIQAKRGRFESRRFLWSIA